MPSQNNLTLVDRTLLAALQQQAMLSVVGPTGPAGPAGASGAGSTFYTVGHAGSGAAYIADGAADQVAINEAISDIAAIGGGVVQLMQSVTPYVLTSAIRMKSNVHLHGQGAGTTIFLANGANDRVVTNYDHVNGNDNFAVRYLYVNGNGTNQTVNTWDALYFLRCRDYWIERNFVFDGNRHNCFSSVACQRGRVLANRFKNSIGLSNISAFEADDMIFSQNVMSDATQTGIKLDDCQSCVIANNVSFNNDTIQLYVTGGSNCTIIGNATRGGENGVRITSQDYTVVSGNVIRDASLNGIHLLQNCQYISITGNLIRNSGGAGTTYSGIYATDVGNGCRDLLISGNTITDVNGKMKYGVQTEALTDYVQYGGNLITGHTTAKYALVGSNNSNTY